MSKAGRLYRYCQNTRFSLLDKALIYLNLVALVALSHLFQNHASVHVVAEKSSVLAQTSNQALVSSIIEPSLDPTTIPISPIPHITTPTSSPTVNKIPTKTPTSLPASGIATLTPPQSSTQTVANSNTPSSSYLSALNTYRQKKGVAPLSWDSTLGIFAQSRADSFASAGGMDEHAGFQNMMNDNGFEKMGFNALGENSGWSDNVEAVYVVESLYANDPPHETNQLNPEWTHVGIGVSGKSTDFVFGGRKR